MWTECKEMQDEIVRMRRELHKIPELSTDLPQTAAYVMKELDAEGIPYRQNKSDSGIVALIQGKPGKVVALRADMDALPIREETGVDYASENGNMHACGHDSHTAMLLCAAKVLNRHKETLNGSVKLIFQTGEETAKGAAIMVKEGALENPQVDALVGLHIGSIIGPEIVLGSVGIAPGPIMASYDKFILKVKGRGCHGSTPEKGIDPVVISAAVISALQQIVSREISGTQPAVITIGKIQGGSAYNIIPDEVMMEGTIRALEQPVRQLLADRIAEVSAGVAKAMRGDCECEIEWGAPPVVNDAAVTAKVQAAAKRVLGEDHVVCSFGSPNMGGEDVAHYLVNVPGTFFFLCSANPEKHTDIPHHNCKFNIDEDVLWEGSAVLVEAVKELLG